MSQDVRLDSVLSLGRGKRFVLLQTGEHDAATAAISALL